MVEIIEYIYIFIRIPLIIWFIFSKSNIQIFYSSILICLLLLIDCFTGIGNYWLNCIGFIIFGLNAVGASVHAYEFEKRNVLKFWDKKVENG